MTGFSNPLSNQLSQIIPLWLHNTTTQNQGCLGYPERGKGGGREREEGGGRGERRGEGRGGERGEREEGGGREGGREEGKEEGGKGGRGKEGGSRDSLRIDHDLLPSLQCSHEDVLIRVRPLSYETVVGVAGVIRWYQSSG